MKMIITSLFCAVFMIGCASGPMRSCYQPSIVDAKFKPPITIEQTEDLDATLQQRKADGYQIVGVSKYTGKFPRKGELVAQAERVGANLVVYQSRPIPQPDTDFHAIWSMIIGDSTAEGGTDAHRADHEIVFLGK